MRNIIKINNEWMPAPDGDLQVVPNKIITRKTTESGKTVAIVTRPRKLTITGEWTLSGEWAAKFREFQRADTVQVDLFYPNPMILSTYECEFNLTKDDQDTGSRKQLIAIGGIYKIEVEMTEI